MPIIRIELLAGRTHEQKARYADEVTRLTADLLNCPSAAVDVVFTEVQPDNWAHAGQLYSTPAELPQ